MKDSCGKAHTLVIEVKPFRVLSGRTSAYKVNKGITVPTLEGEGLSDVAQPTAQRLKAPLCEENSLSILELTSRVSDTEAEQH